MKEEGERKEKESKGEMESEIWYIVKENEGG